MAARTRMMAKGRKAAAAGTQRMGGAGYKKYEGRPTWLPDIDPAKETPWLDGTLPGDRGFDPLGLAKPQEFLQMELDSLDQNKAINAPGAIKGQLATKADVVSTNSLSPYSEVFGLARFRECELMHGRWCMLATLGIVVSEGLTGVSWIDAGKVELAGAQYFNLGMPFDVGTVSWIEFAAMLGVEYYRNTELDTEKRLYPGGVFDPLGFADSEQVDRLKEAEIKHARFAMVSMFGMGTQALLFNTGALESLTKFGNLY